MFYIMIYNYLLVSFVMWLDDVTRKNIVKKIADDVFLSAPKERFENCTGTVHDTYL